MSRILCAVSILIGSLLVGCNRQEDATQRGRITQLETDLQKERQLNQSVSVELDEAKSHLKAQDESSRGEIESLRSQLAAQAEQIQAMSQTIERAKAYVAQLRGQRMATPTPNTSQNNPVYLDFIHAPVGSTPDLYPIYVFNVSGKKVVTGTRTETVWKPKDVVQTDRYGYRTSPSGKWDEKTIKEFDYQVTFSVRNLTKTTKTIRFDAGKGGRDVSLPPAGTLEGQVISAAEGAALNATVAGQTRAFNVSR